MGKNFISENIKKLTLLSVWHEIPEDYFGINVHIGHNSGGCFRSISDQQWSESESRSVLSNSLGPHGLQSMGFSRQEYWSGSLFPPGDLLTQWSNPGLLHYEWILYHLSCQEALHFPLGFQKYFKGIPSLCFLRNWPLVLFLVPFLTLESLLWPSNKLCGHLSSGKLLTLFFYYDHLQKKNG